MSEIDMTRVMSVREEQEVNLSTRLHLLLLRLRRRDVDALISTGDLFEAWAADRAGNVYSLLEEFITIYGKTPKATVGIDWMAWEPQYSRVNGAWVSYRKHPRWFREWVARVGGGKYGTEKAGGEK